MVTVKYEEYTNDFWRKEKKKEFGSIQEFIDWFFGLCDGKYKERISIPNPDRKDIWGDGPSCMEVNCMWTRNRSYWIHEIIEGGRIVFSDGTYTDRQKHWNEEIKQHCRDMMQRKNKPVFNFG